MNDQVKLQVLWHCDILQVTPGHTSLVTLSRPHQAGDILQATLQHAGAQYHVQLCQPGKSSKRCIVAKDAICSDVCDLQTESQ
jgi:hypothetical protein